MKPLLLVAWVSERGDEPVDPQERERSATCQGLWMGVFVSNMT